MATQAPMSTIQPAIASGSEDVGFQREASHGSATRSQNSGCHAADGEHGARGPPGRECRERRKQEVEADDERARDEDPPGSLAEARKIRPLGCADDDERQRQCAPGERRQQEHRRQHGCDQHRRGQNARREHRAGLRV
jgi:hypothetical protein